MSAAAFAVCPVHRTQVAAQPEGRLLGRCKPCLRDATQALRQLPGQAARLARLRAATCTDSPIDPDYQAEATLRMLATATKTRTAPGAATPNPATLPKAAPGGTRVSPNSTPAAGSILSGTSASGRSKESIADELPRIPS